MRFLRGRGFRVFRLPQGHERAERGADQVGQRHGRVAVAAAGRENRAAARQLEDALGQEPDQRQHPDPDGKRVPRPATVRDLPRANQTEERGVEPRKAAVAGELRLEKPDREPDAERSGQQCSGKITTPARLAQRAEDEKRRHIPAQVVGVEVGEVAGEEPPPLARRERRPIQLGRGGEGRRGVDADGQRGEGEGEPGQAAEGNLSGAWHGRHGVRRRVAAFDDEPRLIARCPRRAACGTRRARRYQQGVREGARDVRRREGKPTCRLVEGGVVPPHSKVQTFSRVPRRPRQ